MRFIFSFLICGIFFVLIRYFLVIRKFYRCSKDFPGASGLALLRNILEFRSGNAIFHKFALLRKKFESPMSFWFGPKFLLFFAKPSQIEVILNSNKCYDKTRDLNFFTNIIGSGLINSTGEKWAKHRKLLNPTMSHKHLLKYFSSFNAESNILVTKLKGMIGKGDFHILKMIEKCNINITGLTILDTNLSIQDEKTSLLTEALEQGKNIFELRIFTIPYHFEVVFRLSKWYKIQREIKAFSDEFFSNLIKDKVQENQSADNNLKNNFIHQVLNIAATREDFDVENVKENLMAFYIAALDTTGRTVANTIFCLAAHPEHQQRVIEEVAELFPEKNSEITFADTKNMVYTEMIINETLRLFPPVPLIGRHVIEDFYFQGKLIPKDTHIAIDIFNLHRDKDIWGPNHNKFYPDHFLPRNVAEMHPYQFIPFSKGPRNCIGWRFAYMLMKVMLARIFQNFRFTTDFKLEEIKFVMNSTLKAVNEPLIKIHKLEL